MNRSFKFGDGLFETMRWQAGNIFNLELHSSRLINGLSVLGIQTPKGFNAGYLEHLISTYINQEKQNANLPNWRVRISCFRGGAGLYTPLSNKMEYFIEASPLGSADFFLNEKGLCLTAYEEVFLSADILSPLKTTSALPYVMAAQYRQSLEAVDDCILLNTNYRIAETIAANLFYRIENDLYTPALTEACVAGTMRAWVLRFAENLGLQAHETQVKLEDLTEADEIFLTNAIQGIRWVKSLDWKPELQFSNRCSKVLTQALNQALTQMNREI